MSELQPDQLGYADSSKQQGKKKAISNILEWIQCFCIYISVIAGKQPQQVPDLLGYMHLIIEANLQYGNDGWQGYDRRFRQVAASSSNVEWARVDTTLWNLGFTNHGNATCCKHCFSLHHSHANCEWAPEPTTTWVPSSATS